MLQCVYITLVCRYHYNTIYKISVISIKCDQYGINISKCIIFHLDFSENCWLILTTLFRLKFNLTRFVSFNFIELLPGFLCFKMSCFLPCFKLRFLVYALIYISMVGDNFPHFYSHHYNCVLFSPRAKWNVEEKLKFLFLEWCLVTIIPVQLLYPRPNVSHPICPVNLGYFMVQ